MADVQTLQVQLGERSYPIYFGSGLETEIAAAVAAARAKGQRLLVVTDANVRAALQPLFSGALADVPALTVAPGETSKSLIQFAAACEFMAREKIDRGGALIAVGGGVVGDLGGFLAAAYLRGIDFWQIPTTLLAMVDSAVGGKTGVNLEAGKNLVGAFHQPRAVYCDMTLLHSLPPREFSAGMAEVIKYGLLADPNLFSLLEAEPMTTASDSRLGGVVRRCCAIKAEVVQADERETAASGGRALLNLGHTFAHAVEAVAGYGQYLHGEAVGIGLVAAAHLSARLDLISAADVVRVQATVAAHGLPVRLRAPLARGLLMDAMKRDKKVKHGQLRFVVLDALGRAATRDGVDSNLAAEIWQDLGAA